MLVTQHAVVQRAAIRGGLETALGNRAAHETGSQGEVRLGSISLFLLLSFVLHFSTE